MDDSEQIYAVSYLGSTWPFRLFKAQYAPGTDRQVMVLDDPDGGVVNVPRGDLILHGEWEDKANYGDTEMTWAQLAAHYYGEVLRQRDLVSRLGQLGIVREPEPYNNHQEPIVSVARRTLHLNYDELDILLTRAGV